MVSMSARGLLLLDFDDFASFVLTAVRADAVGQLGLVAVRALREAGRLQGVVRAARGGPLGGVSTFRIRHFSKTSLLDHLISNLRSAPQRSWCSSAQPHSVSFRFLPQAGQMPL